MLTVVGLPVWFVLLLIILKQSAMAAAERAALALQEDGARSRFVVGALFGREAVLRASFELGAEERRALAKHLGEYGTSAAARSQLKGLADKEAEVELLPLAKLMYRHSVICPQTSCLWPGFPSRPPAGRHTTSPACPPSRSCLGR